MVLRLVLILALAVQPMLAGVGVRACDMHAQAAAAIRMDCASVCCVQIVEEPACPFCTPSTADGIDCGRCCPIQTPPTEHRTVPSEEKKPSERDVGELAPRPWTMLLARGPVSCIRAERRLPLPPRSGRERLVTKSVLTI